MSSLGRPYNGRYMASCHKGDHSITAYCSDSRSIRRCCLAFSATTRNSWHTAAQCRNRLSDQSSLHPIPAPCRLRSLQVDLAHAFPLLFLLNPIHLVITPLRYEYMPPPLPLSSVTLPSLHSSVLIRISRLALPHSASSASSAVQFSPPLREPPLPPFLCGSSRFPT